MTKSQIKTLNQRIINLREELTDPTCQKFPAARQHVQTALDEALAQLAAG